MEDEDPENAVREKRAKNELGPEWRPSYDPREFIARGAEGPGVAIDELRSRGRARKPFQARELLIVVGVERYGLMVNQLDRAMADVSDVGLEATPS